MRKLSKIKHIHGGNLWLTARESGVDPLEILDFSANINPLGPSPAVFSALIDNLSSIIHYPDPQCMSIRENLAEWLGLHPDNIIMGNGAVELIYLLIAALKPQRVLIPAPTFSEYEAAVLSSGGEVIDFPLHEEQDFRVDVTALTKELPRVEMLVLCNPNNPTGQVLTSSEVQYIIEEAAKHQVFVLVDEAFIDFTADKINFTVSNLVDKYDNLFVLYSLTKIFGIPGLRLGAGLGNQKLITKLTERKDPWNVNSLAQIAGLVSLQDPSYLESVKELIEVEKNYLWRELGKIKGLCPLYPSVNYILIKLPEKYTAQHLQQKLIPYQIMLRDCTSFKNLNQYYVRVAVKDREKNDRLLQAMRVIYEEGEH